MEYYKILANKKCLLLLLLLYVCSIIFFAKGDWGVNTNQVEDEQNYLASFTQKIDDVLAESDKLSTFSIFKKKDSFSENNIQKTKSDFQTIKNIKVTELSGHYLVPYFAYEGVKYSLLFGSIIIAIMFLEPRAKALKCLINTCINGRTKFTLRRITAISSWFAIYVLLIKITILGVSIICNGGNVFSDWNKPIQCVQSFCYLTKQWSIGQFILIDLAQSFISCLLVALLVWTVFWLCEHFLISLGILFALAFIEYILYVGIRPGQSTEGLHYINLYYNCLDFDFWTKYKNLNICSTPISAYFVNFIFYGICILGIIIVAVTVSIYRYPIRNGIKTSGKVILFVRQKYELILGRIQERFCILGADFYKLLISQKGLMIFIVAIAIFVYRNPLAEVKFVGFQESYNSFIEKNGTVLCDQSYLDLESIQKEINQENERYEKSLKDYEDGNLSDDEALESSMIHDAMAYKEKLYEKLSEQTAYLEQLEQEKNIKGWYVNNYSYKMLLQKEDIINVILLVLFISLMSSACIDSEKNGMLEMIHSTIVGRKKIFRSKLMVAGIMILLFYGVMIMMRILSVIKSYGISGLFAPAQSYYKLENFPLPINLLEYVILYFGINVLVLICFSGISVIINFYLNSRLAAGVTVILGILGYYIRSLIGGYIFAFVLIVVTVYMVFFQKRRWAQGYEIRD